MHGLWRAHVPRHVGVRYDVRMAACSNAPRGCWDCRRRVAVVGVGRKEGRTRSLRAPASPYCASAQPRSGQWPTGRGWEVV